MSIHYHIALRAMVVGRDAVKAIHARPLVQLLRACALAITTSAALLSITALSYADPAPMIHYAPAENLEHADVALINTAQREIDLAAMSLPTGR